MSAAQLLFGNLLKKARESFRDAEHGDKGLTLRELGRRAGMNFARIGDFEKGRRCAGEDTLKRLAEALNLEGAEARDFILQGLRASGQQKLPQEFIGVPSQAFEVLVREIQLMNKGEVPAPFQATERHDGCDLLWQTADGQWFAMEIVVAKGGSPGGAVRKLQEKIREKAECQPGGPARSKG